MKLTIDGREVLARKEQSLLSLVREAGLDSELLSARPLAARIAGEVFTLNYIPLREKDGEGDRPSMRRAMAASQGVIHLLRCRDSAGRDVYVRTAQFVMFLALSRLWPKAACTMDCTLGSSVFVSVRGAEDFSAARLKEEVGAIVRQDIPLLRRHVKKDAAIARYRAQGREDKARLLTWLERDSCSEYVYEGYSDNFFG